VDIPSQFSPFPEAANFNSGVFYAGTMLSGYSSIGFGLMIQVLMVKAEEK
jgi:hypothetical protein